MSEIRFIRENKVTDCVTLSNHFLKDDQLSWKAKGVMSYLSSLPDDYQIIKSEIQKHASDGRDSLTSAINELKNAGYISKDNKIIKGGR